MHEYTGTARYSSIRDEFVDGERGYNPLGGQVDDGSCAVCGRRVGDHLEQRLGLLVLLILQLFHDRNRKLQRQFSTLHVSCQAS